MIEVKDNNPFSLPYVALSDRSLLPKNSAIYLVIAEKNEIISIGKACWLVDRWHDHHTLHLIESSADVRSAWIACDGMSATEQFRLEQECMRLFLSH